MRLPFGRRSAATISVEPATVRPGEAVRVTVALDEALDDVESARVVLGYENTYWYLRAGASHGTPGLFEPQTSSSGSNPDKERTDWVDAGEQALPVVGGVLEAGTRTIELPVPSWAPGTADQVCDWRARLEVHRKGRHLEQDAELTVLSPPPAELPPLTTEALSSGETAAIEIELDRNIVRPGEHVTGTVTLTAAGDAPDADVAVYLRWCKVSHPLERTPAMDREGMQRPVVTLNKKQRLLPGMPVALPFDVQLEPEARPSVQTVHADFGWALVVRILYAGFNAHVPQSVARPFVVVNA